MSSRVKEMFPVILEAIKKSSTILLHCHPSPDPDSVGSVLAMKGALEQLGKKVTVIKGDSEIPKAFGHFPGVKDITSKNFSEINLSDFDLFIILDSGSPDMISRISVPSFPLSIPTITIDHHATNTGYASMNLVDPTYPATAQILFDLFKLWNIKITPEIASNLFIGMYTDTGGFKYAGTSSETLSAASELASISPDFNQMILKMENSRTKASILYNGLALSSIQYFFDDRLVISAVSFKEISKYNILSEDISSVPVANILISVASTAISVSMSEQTPGEIRLRFRSKDSEKYDISKLATALGGGGHKMAAGARLNSSLEEGIKKVVETAKIIYNL